MFSLLLALGAPAPGQTTELASDPYRAALICANVVGKSEPMPGKTSLQHAAEVSYLLFQAARYRRSATPLLERLPEIQNDFLALPVFDAQTKQALLPQCDARFPMARRDGPVALPADPFEQSLICVMALETIAGAAARFKEMTGDGTELDYYTPPGKIYWKRLQAGLRGAGFTDEKDLFTRGGDRFLPALELGNPYVVSRACIAALKD